MKILIIGANGQIGTRLVKQLKESEHTPVAMVRKKDQVGQFENEGIETVLADLEEDIGHAFKNVDVVVFSAGSGAHTPKSQTKVIDEQGAVKAIDAAIDAGVNRFIMVSALMANRDPDAWPDSMKHYYEAKSKADDHLRSAGLNYTILMPGRLTNDEGNRKVELNEEISDLKDRSITRDDVASVIVEMVDSENTYHKSLDLLQGDETVQEAVAKIS